jgi:hypothetical protein
LLAGQASADCCCPSECSISAGEYIDQPLSIPAFINRARKRVVPLIRELLCNRKKEVVELRVPGPLDAASAAVTADRRGTAN